MSGSINHLSLFVTSLCIAVIIPMATALFLFAGEMWFVKAAIIVMMAVTVRVINFLSSLGLL